MLSFKYALSFSIQIYEGLHQHRHRIDNFRMGHNLLRMLLVPKYPSITSVSSQLMRICRDDLQKSIHKPTCSKQLLQQILSRCTSLDQLILLLELHRVLLYLKVLPYSIARILNVNTQLLSTNSFQEQMLCS